MQALANLRLRAFVFIANICNLLKSLITSTSNCKINYDLHLFEWYKSYKINGFLWETELLQLNGLYRSTCKPTILSTDLFALLCRDFFQYMVQTGQIIVGDDWRINGSLCCSSGKLISREKRSHLWIIWSCHRKSRTIRLLLEQRLVRFCCSDEQREILFDIPDVLLSIVGNPPAQCCI